MTMLDDPARLAEHPLVQVAAQIAHMFKQDPLVVLAGWDGARRIEASSPALALNVRIAAGNIVAQDIREAQAKARKEQEQINGRR